MIGDRQEISWTIWGPSVPHIGSRPIERNHRRSSSTARISRLRSDPRWGAIGHSRVQVISCGSPNPFGRRITHLRVSVSDRCNLRCTHSIRDLAIRPALEAALTNKPKQGGSCTDSWMHGIGG